MNEEQAQQLYTRFMALQEQAQELDHHYQGMQEQMRNILQTKQTITELQKLEEPTETWVPIAPGAYVKARVSPADTVLINVGSSAAVEKTPESVLTTLDEHHKVLEELAVAAMEELKKIMTEIEQIKSRVEKDAPEA